MLPSGGERLLHSDQEHEQALTALGFTRADFSMMIQEEDDSQEKDTCKICFVNEINAVILPCGHFAICTVCGQSLKGKRCPICRKGIKRIQQIFRS